MKDNWKLVLDTLSILGGALAWVYQWWNLRFRSQLKADFEILKSLESLGQEDNNYRIVRAHIDATIAKAYSCGRLGGLIQTNQKGTGHVNKMDFAFAILFFLGSGLWIIDIIVLGTNWWRILIAIGFASTGFVALFNVLHKRHVSQNVNATNVPMPDPNGQERKSAVSA